MDQKKKVKRCRKPNDYAEDTLQQCIQSIKRDKKSVYDASKAYGIPESTVRFRLSGNWSQRTTKGPSTVLLPEEEDKIILWLKEMERKGFPVVKQTLMFKVKEFLDSSQRPNPFKENMPGRKWFSRFLARHDNITLRIPESVTAASSKVSESDIRGWFANVSDYLSSAGLLHIIEDPRRIYNGDETSFFLHPKTKSVLATPGSKNMYEVEHADGHTNVTVMFSFGADGTVVPPDVVLPVQRIRPEILQQFPGDWGVGKSPNGWMNVENFMLYIRKIFYPYLQKKNVEFPVLFFIDGHSSHTAAEVADLCLDLGIILVALYPNTTRITQPADVAIFKPLKNAWRTAVSDWRFENGGEMLSLKQFPSVLQKAIDQGIQVSSIINGFRVCGLYPFGPDNVDYTKCLARSIIQQPESSIGLLSEQNETPFGTDHLSFDDLHVVSTIENSFPSEDFALIPISPTLKEALDGIGMDRLQRIKSSEKLNADEEIIRLLYTKLLEPQLPLLTPSNGTDCNQSGLIDPDDFAARDVVVSGDMQGQDDPNNCATDGSTGDDDDNPNEDGEYSQVGKLDATKDGTNADNFIEDEAHSYAGTVTPLVDCTNTQGTRRSTTDDLEDFLQTPPTPKRSQTHRNYSRKFFPVLTAEERLNEIRRLDREKEDALKLKKEKAEQREIDKQRAEALKTEKAAQREAIKKEKADIRDRKRLEVLQRKQERENKRKSNELKAESMKKQKLDLLQALKLTNSSSNRLF